MRRRSVVTGRKFAVAAIALLGAWSAAVRANEALIAPQLHLTAREVVELQLDALRNNDAPHPDAGIEQAWALAHPDNKAFTGPLARFAVMIKGPQYRVMLNHRSHTVEEIAHSDSRVTFFVTIESASSRAVGFEWTVERVADGELAGCWMTTGVSPPIPLGEII